MTEVYKLNIFQLLVEAVPIILHSRVAQLVAALQPGCEKMEREWENEEEMERDLDKVGSTVCYEMIKLCTGSV